MKFILPLVSIATTVVAKKQRSHLKYGLDVFKDEATAKLIASTGQKSHERVSLPEDTKGTAIYATSGYSKDSTCNNLQGPEYAVFYDIYSWLGPTGECHYNSYDETSKAYLCDESNLYIEYFGDGQCSNYTTTSTLYDFFTDYEYCSVSTGSYSYENGITTYKCSLSDDVYTEAGVTSHVATYEYSYDYSDDTVDPDYTCTQTRLEQDVGYYDFMECEKVYSYFYDDSQCDYVEYDLCSDGEHAYMNKYNDSDVSTGCAGTPAQTTLLNGGCYQDSVITCV